MTNKKKILIETLHGSVAQLNELSAMTEGIDIYDATGDRKSTRLNSSHVRISYAVFCLKKKKKI